MAFSYRCSAGWHLAMHKAALEAFHRPSRDRDSGIEIAGLLAEKSDCAAGHPGKVDPVALEPFEIAQQVVAQSNDTKDVRQVGDAGVPM